LWRRGDHCCAPSSASPRLASAVADAWCRAVYLAPRLARRSIEIAIVHQVMRHERAPAHV
jgi:hypothetical protein